MRKVGVLALQGDYAAHGAALSRVGGEWFEVRTPADIEKAEAFVLPGGESTVIGSLLVRFGLLDALVAKIRDGAPVLGTCAGLILLAAEIEGSTQPGIRLLNVAVKRNAYGRQIDSFRALVSTSVPGAESIEAVFIRAPKIIQVGKGVDVLARHNDDPILVKQGAIVGATFHPELIESATIHRWFLSL